MPNAKERRCGGQSQKLVEYVWPLASDGPTTSRAEFQTRVFLRFGNSVRDPFSGAESIPLGDFGWVNLGNLTPNLKVIGPLLIINWLY